MEIEMAKKYRVTIKNNERGYVIKPSKEFTGRLIGLIDRETTRAVVNTPDSARKIYSSDTIELSEIPDAVSTFHGLRFVIASDDYSEHKRTVFISPIIKYAAFVLKGRAFNCMNNREYMVQEV